MSLAHTMLIREFLAPKNRKEQNLSNFRLENRPSQRFQFQQPERLTLVLTSYMCMSKPQEISVGPWHGGRNSPGALSAAGQPSRANCLGDAGCGQGKMNSHTAIGCLFRVNYWGGKKKKRWWGMDCLLLLESLSFQTQSLPFPAPGLPGAPSVHSNRTFLLLHTLSCQLPSTQTQLQTVPRPSCTRIVHKLIQFPEIACFKHIWKHLIKYPHDSYISTFTSILISWRKS